MKKYQSFLSETFQFSEVKFSVYLNRRVFVMNNSCLCAFRFIWSKGRQNMNRRVLFTCGTIKYIYSH